MTPGHFLFVEPIDDASLKPIGHSNFAKLVRAYNANPEVPFIDKTQMIESIFKHMDAVTLFTRPRRFGKSTNMSMLYYFLGVPEAQKELHAPCFSVCLVPELMGYEE